MEGRRQVMEIPSSVGAIHRVQTAVHEVMKRFGYDDDACFAVKLAIEESIVNAMKHGNKFDPERSVHVRYDVDDRQVRVCIKDEGRGFDPRTVPDPTREENLTKPHGRGIMLMRAYMDTVAYSDCGTEVTMIKRKR